VKKMGIVYCLLLLAGLTASALSVCDYSAPETALTDARLSFGYRYYDDANTAGVVDVNSGRFGADYYQLYDSPNYGFTIGAYGELELNAFVPTGWLGQGSATFRYYPYSEGLLFAFGGLQASLATGQLRPGADVLIGAGLGRFSDVTPMAKAFAIEDELLDLDAIGDPLSSDVLLAIAGSIGREAEVEELQDLVSEIEALIEGVAGVELDARALLSIEEIILMTGDERRCGWALQVGVGYEILDPYAGAQNVVVGASADAAFAMGPSDQLAFHASYSGPFDLMTENTLNASLGYEYELSEDSTLFADYAMQRVNPADPSLAVNVSHAAGIAIGFDVAGVDILLEVALTHETGDLGWSFDVSVSAAMDLL